MRTSAVVFGALTLLLLVLVAAGWPPLVAFDRSVAEALHRQAVDHPGLTQANRILSDWVWDPWTLRSLTGLVVLALWWRGRRRLALWVAGTCLVAAGLQHALKALVGRERPVWPDPVDSASYAAFPSGHAMTAAVVSGLLLWVFALTGRAPWRGWGTAAGLAVVTVAGAGWTRLHLGVHWPTDVLGGWLLGWCCVAVAVLAYRRWPGDMTKPPALDDPPCRPGQAASPPSRHGGGTASHAEYIGWQPVNAGAQHVPA